MDGSELLKQICSAASRLDSQDGLATNAKLFGIVYFWFYINYVLTESNQYSIAMSTFGFCIGWISAHFASMGSVRRCLAFATKLPLA
jgi:hypothetical protein